MSAAIPVHRLSTCALRLFGAVAVDKLRGVSVQAFDAICLSQNGGGRGVRFWGRTIKLRKLSYSRVCPTMALADSAAHFRKASK